MKATKKSKARVGVTAQLAAWRASRDPKLADELQRAPARFDIAAIKRLKGGRHLAKAGARIAALPDDPRVTVALAE